MQLEKQRTIIGQRTQDLKNIQELEEKLRSKINELALIAERTCATTINLKKLVDSPLDYIVNTYRAMWLGDRPDHLDYRLIVENETKLNTNEVQKLGVEINNLIKKMKHHAPKINAKSIISNINENDFDVYLNENQRDEYEATVKVIEALEQYRPHTNHFPTLNFIRGIQGAKFNDTMDGLAISLQHFKA